MLKWNKMAKIGPFCLYWNTADLSGKIVIFASFQQYLIQKLYEFGPF